MAKSEREQAARIGRELRQVAEAGIRAIVTTTTREAAAASPVDSGLTRDSWRVSKSPPGDASGDRSPSGVARAKAEQEASLARAAGYTLAQGRVHVVNAEPASDAANLGRTSAQAGFVQRAIREGLSAGEAAARAASRRRGGGGR